MSWTRQDASTEGQVGELLVWAALEAQSLGALHVFLPIWDQGIDALVHRRTDGAYLAVQVKVRQPRPDGSIHLVVAPSALSDPSATMIVAPITAGALGDWSLVLTETDFRAIGSSEVHPERDPWERFVVETAHLAERFGAPSAPASGPPAARPAPGWLGRLGEAEVVRRLAAAEALQLFRAYPDDELVEIAARDAASHSVTGYQVKAVGVDRGQPRATMMIRTATFVPSPETRVVVLAWHRERGEFDPECLLIPSVELPSIAELSGDHYRFKYHPGSPDRTILDPYRIRLEDLLPPKPTGPLVDQRPG